MDDDFSGRGGPMPYPEPHLRRLEQLERMLESMDRMDPTVGQPPPRQGYLPPSHPPPPPHHLHQMDPHLPMHPSQMERDGGRGWMYPERGRPTPQQIVAARQQQMMAAGGPRSTRNWAVEMEQRRLQELRQMQLAKEKEGMYGGGIPAGVGYGGKGLATSKPNISLLPTAVMRHIHTNKPSPTVSVAGHVQAV